MARRSRYVISDATVLIFLDRIRLMAVLRKLYRRIVVPEAVYQEVERGRKRGRPGPDLLRFPWVDVRRVPSRAAEVSGPGLGEGEAAVLSLAISLRPHNVFILIDDHRGRSLATVLGFDRTGTLGVLLEAKRTALIPRVKPYLLHLVAAGLWVSPAVPDGPRIGGGMNELP
jgi:predicted nucleic acid-binding protein